jgi:hypothetical protein
MLVISPKNNNKEKRYNKMFYFIKIKMLIKGIKLNRDPDAQDH